MWKRLAPLSRSAQATELFPNKGTTRGRLMIQHILLDLYEITRYRPIKYLALYERNLLAKPVDKKVGKKQRKRA